MKISQLYKIRPYIWSKIVAKSRDTKWYPCLYRSYWHMKLCKKENEEEKDNYFTAVPNRSAGIGHQLANWIAGFWFSKFFNLKFAHIPFSDHKWETFLGFGENEISAIDLIKNCGYKKVRLPLFKETNSLEVERIKKIIKSYYGGKIVFVAEQDQFYHDQYGIMDDLKKKFQNCKFRAEDKLFFSSKCYNIAIHIRRGDITNGLKNGNANLRMRWQENQYYLNALNCFLKRFKVSKPIAIYLFSQGEKRNFSEFDKLESINYCLDISPIDSFLHMVYADLLITSKSSFSYKAALLSNGMKICPKNFWHGYPNTKDFILADENGQLLIN